LASNHKQNNRFKLFNFLTFFQKTSIFFKNCKILIQSFDKFMKKTEFAMITLYWLEHFLTINDSIFFSTISILNCEKSLIRVIVFL